MQSVSETTARSRCRGGGLRRTILVAAVLLTASACADPRPADDAALAESEVGTAVARYDRAAGAGDRAALDSILHPAFVYFSSRGGVRSRDWFLDFLTSPEYELDQARRSEIEVRGAGATAVVESRWTGSGNWRGTRFEDDQRCSLTVHRDHDGWRILAEHCTPIETGGG